MKNLLSFIIKSIIGSPKKVKIAQEKIDQLTKFTVTAPKDQIGIIIGRQGKIIKAIKILLALQAKNEHFTIEIEES